MIMATTASIDAGDDGRDYDENDDAEVSEYWIPIRFRIQNYSFFFRVAW